MDEMEFTEAESNMNDLVSEYQQYQVRYWSINNPALILKLILFKAYSLGTILSIFLLFMG